MCVRLEKKRASDVLFFSGKKDHSAKMYALFFKIKTPSRHTNTNMTLRIHQKQHCCSAGSAPR